MFDRERIESAFSSRYHQLLLWTEQECARSVTDALRTHLSHIEPSSWIGRIEWGGVFVNGREVRSDDQLPTPCKLEYYEPKFCISEAEKFFPPFNTDQLLYEDDEILIVFKPPGLPAMPGKEQKHFNLRSYLERYLGRAIHMPSRLDMSTAGVVATSKAESMHNALQRVFEQGRIEKEYRLEVSGDVPWAEQIHHGAIGRDKRHAVLRRVVPEEGKPSLTVFRSLERRAPAAEHLPRSTLVQALPKTGRTHQIRVHAADLGYPIIGDNFYGGIAADGLRLLSYRVRFNHPHTRREIEITVPDRLAPAWARSTGAP